MLLRVAKYNMKIIDSLNFITAGIVQTTKHI